jgi:hypothetical protein
MVSSAIRARWPQRIALWWTEHDPAELAAATGRLADGVMRSIQESAATEWIDIGLHLDFIDALREVGGAASFGRRYVDASDHALALPVFESMIRPLVRLAGRRALVHGFPRGWGMIMRGCGEIEVVQRRGDPGSTVTYTEVPRALATREVYRESVASVLEAVMIRGGFPGAVELDAAEAARGVLVYRMLELDR